MMAKVQVLKLKDVDLHYREDGDPQGRPVVFANSLGTDMRLWDAVIPLLPEGLRIIRYDKRGHGLSSCPSVPYTMQALSEDAEQLLDHLAVRDCVFVGLSIGGMIAQSLAASRPDLIRALVLSNTAAKMGEPSAWNTRIAAIEEGGIESLADAILSRWFAPSFLQKPEASAWRNMLTRSPSAGYIGCCHAIAQADLSRQTATLKQPTLGIAGSDDGASTPELVQATIDTIEDSRFELIDDAGHLPCVEKPEIFAAHLNSFLLEMANA